MKSPEKQKKTKNAPAATPVSEAEIRVAAVRSMAVEAGPCPLSPNHQARRVYRTVGKTRYCVCDDCGHTWKVIGPEAVTAATPSES